MQDRPPITVAEMAPPKKRPFMLRTTCTLQYSAECMCPGQASIHVQYVHTRKVPWFERFCFFCVCLSLRTFFVHSTFSKGGISRISSKNSQTIIGIFEETRATTRERRRQGKMEAGETFFPCGATEMSEKRNLANRTFSWLVLS